MLATIRVPTLVIHGDADRVLPLAHAHSLAAGIARGDLVVKAGMGDLPRPVDWDAIAEHTATHVFRAV